MRVDAHSLIVQHMLHCDVCRKMHIAGRDIVSYEGTVVGIRSVRGCSALKALIQPLRTDHSISKSGVHRAKRDGAAALSALNRLEKMR